MGGHREKSSRDERTHKRGMVNEKRCRKHMRKSIKRLDQSHKEINFEKSHKRELEKLKEL